MPERTDKDIARDLLTAFELRAANGKSAEGEPAKGAYTVHVRRGIDFRGEPAAVVRDLKKGYPEASFEFRG